MRHHALIAALTSLLLIFAGGCLHTAPDANVRHQQAVDLFSEGLVKEREGQWRDAITLYEQSLAIAPVPVTHFHLGLCQTRLGNLQSAENHFTRALELSPSYDLAQTHLLQVQARLAESAPAEPPAPAAEPTPAPLVRDITPELAPEPIVVEVPVDPPHAEPVIEAPEVETPPAPTPAPAEPDPVEVAQEAAPQSDAMAAPQEEMPSVDEVRGLLFPRQHGDTNATTGADRLRQSNLQNPDFHMGQAAVFEAQQDYVNALREYRLAFDRDRTRVDAMLAAARVHARMGHEQEAIEAYETAQELAPTNPEVPYQMGNHFFRQGDFEHAKSLYEESLSLNERQPPVLNNLGAALRELREFDDAIGHLERAIEIDPTYAPPHRNLGNIFAERGRDREALDEYREYVRLGGSSSAEVSNWIRELEMRLGEN